MNIKSLSLPVSLWLIAFICALYPINAWQLFFFAVSILSLFAWAFTVLSRKMSEGWSLPRSPVLIFAGLFWLLVFASVFWSEVKPASLMAVCLFTGLPLTFFVGVIGGDEAFFKKLICILGVVFAVLSAWAVFQFFFLNAYFWGQARHPLGDPSSLGALLSLGLFCTFGWILAKRPKREHNFAVALAVLLICGILSTVSRGPVMAFIPGFALLCVLLWPQVKANRKSLMIVLIGGFVFYGITLTNVQKRFDLASRLLGAQANTVEDFSNNRLDVWSSTMDIIKEHPLLGTGYGTFFLYYPEHRRVTEIDGAHFAHNDPLQFWAETGIMGPLLFYAFVIAAIMRSFSALKKLKGENDIRDRIIIASIFAGLTSMVAGAHVGFNHYNLSILMIAGLLLAVWFLTSAKVLQEPVKTTVMPDNVPAGVNKLLLALPFALTAWLLLSIVAGEVYASRASKDLFREQMFHFADDINMANRVSQGMNARAFMLAVNVPMSILEFKKDKADEKEKKELYDQVVRYMHIVMEINPRAPEPYYYLGKVQTMVPSSIISPDEKTPEEYYKKALSLDPLYLGSRMALYELYKTSGRSLDEQLAVLEGGLTYYYYTPMAGEYYSELAKLYLEMRNYGKMNAVLLTLRDFQKRSDFSRVRQETSIPQAIMGGEEKLPKFQ